MFPRINKLKAFRPRINSSVNSSQGHLDISALNDLTESIQFDTPIPFYKSQYSIGQKWIPYKKQGKMSYLRARYNSHNYE